MKRKYILRVIDVGDEEVQIQWERKGEQPQSRKIARFKSPLNLDDQAALKWYLEDYLDFPFGAEEDKAKSIETRFKDWGRVLWRDIFTDEISGKFYREAIDEGLNLIDFVIRSDKATFLNIPWELLYDPWQESFIVPLFGGLYRVRSTPNPLKQSPKKDNSQFNVLLIISRPLGERDARLRTIAKPMLVALDELGDRVRVEVLRPPTFDHFAEVLNSRREFYDLVHFDGHGLFDFNPRGNSTIDGNRREGALVFEDSNGRPDIVSAEKLRQLIANCGVPLFILNACQSSQEGDDDPFSSVASSLISIGVSGVVAMSYSIYVAAAKLFMEKLYTSLVEGSNLSEAVAAGRRALLANPQRPSLLGNRSILDWIVPVLYQQVEGYHPLQESQGEREKKKSPRPPAVGLPSESSYAFIGRDYDILRLERTLEKHFLVNISGLSGIGKTQFACGFARWMIETGGYNDGVFYKSFENLGSMSSVISDIGSALLGGKFAQLTYEGQEKFVTDYLRMNQCLVIWDNFETASNSMNANRSYFDLENSALLTKFLNNIKSGMSRVLIISRRKEELQPAPDYFQLRGLNRLDSVDFANRILERASVDANILGPEYERLLRLLNGHPLSMRVILPQLHKYPASELVQALRKGLDTLNPIYDEEGNQSLTASLNLCFSGLSARAKKHLPILGFFAGRLRVFVLEALSQTDAYVSIMNERIDRIGLNDVLKEAQDAGILESLNGSNVYSLHPALPFYLRAKLNQQLSNGNMRKLENLFLEAYASLGSVLFRKLESKPAEAISEVIFEEPNLLNAAQIAIESKNWTGLQAVLQPILLVRKIKGELQNESALMDYFLSKISLNIEHTNSTEEGNLLLFLLSSKAMSGLRQGNFSDAEAIYMKMLRYLAQTTPKREEAIAVVYHQLGMIARSRNKPNDGESWFRKALSINERLRLSNRGFIESNMAGNLGELGRIAQSKGKLEEAEVLSRESLSIFEKLGDEANSAIVYSMLGDLAYERSKLEEAEELLRKSLSIYERLGNKIDAAEDYHKLGIIADSRGNLEAAEFLFKKALTIYEQLGDKTHAVLQYHQLGIIAQKRHKLDEAEAWSIKSLAVFESLDDEVNSAIAYHQLGRLAYDRGNLDEAETWANKALKVNELLRDEIKVAASILELGRIAQGRGKLQEAEEFMEKALFDFKRLHNLAGQGICLGQLGNLAEQRKDLLDAEKHYREALDAFIQNDNKVYITQTKMILERLKAT